MAIIMKFSRSTWSCRSAIVKVNDVEFRFKKCFMLSYYETNDMKFTTEVVARRPHEETAIEDIPIRCHGLLQIRDSQG